MKNLRSLLFALTVLLMATAAQAQQTSLKANVPFDFVVADHDYPAGEYTLQSMLNSGLVIRIKNIREASPGIALSSECSSREPSATTKLVFHRLGDRYFLYQVWIEGNSSGRQFRMSNTEIQLAQNKQRTELVIVAANLSH